MDSTAFFVVMMFVLLNIVIEKFIIGNVNDDVQITDLLFRAVIFLGGYYTVPVFNHLMHG